MAFHLFVFLLVIFLCLALLRRLCWFPFSRPPHEERLSARRSTVCGIAPLPRRLPRLPTRFHCLVGCRASACYGVSLARGVPAPNTWLIG
jgi:hypothetical protein